MKRKKQVEEELQFYWVVTAKHTLGSVRHVYPTEEEANNHADMMRKRKNFKNVEVNKGGQR